MEIKHNIEQTIHDWYNKRVEWYQDKYEHDFNLSLYEIMDILRVSKSFINTQIAPSVDYINIHSTLIAEHITGGKKSLVYFNRQQFWDWMKKNWVCTQATAFCVVPQVLADKINALIAKLEQKSQLDALNDELQRIFADENLDSKIKELAARHVLDKIKSIEKQVKNIIRPSLLEAINQCGWEIAGTPEFDGFPNERQRTDKFAVQLEFNPAWFADSEKYIVSYPKFSNSAELFYRDAYSSGAIKLTYTAQGKAIAKKTVFVFPKNTTGILLFPEQYLTEK